jgi:hypothetical protein
MTSAGEAFAFGGRLARIGDTNVLFSPTQRAIFELNDTAADIWNALVEGMPREVIAGEIARSGLKPGEAARYVDGALHQWEQLGLIRPEAGAMVAETGASEAQVLSVGGLHARIGYPLGLEDIRAVFRHLEDPGGASPDLDFRIVESGGRLHLFRDGRWLLACAPVELATVLKGELLERADYEIALHAAALIRNGRTLLLGGEPGAGKTTLSMALMQAGMAFAGDDVAVLRADGSCLGLPFAPAIKAGAWPVLAAISPDIAAAPVYRRPDRRRVRYPGPRGFVASGPRPVGWLVLLDRRQSVAAARLEPTGSVEALRGMLRGSFAMEGELTDRAFDTLIRVIAGAGAFRLVYSDLAAAVRLLCALCDDDPCRPA